MKQYALLERMLPKEPTLQDARYGWFILASEEETAFYILPPSSSLLTVVFTLQDRGWEIATLLDITETQDAFYKSWLIVKERSHDA